MKIFNFFIKNNKKEEKKDKYENIKSLITIITPIGVVLAFLILNYQTIFTLINPTKISLSMKEKFLYQTNTFINLSNKDNNLTIPIESLKKGLSISSGSYRISLIYYNKKIWESFIFIEKGKNTAILLPTLQEDKIILNVKNYDPNPFEGTRMNLDIKSSGNGCLWIYDINKNKAIKIHPLTNECSPIYAGEVISTIHLSAGLKKKSDTILFLVTASKLYEDANNIVSKKVGKKINKGTIDSDLNWGTYILQYPIRKIK